MLHSRSAPRPFQPGVPLVTPRQSHKTKIYRSFLRGMVELFVLQRAGRGPVYGGSLSKSLRTLGYEISPGSLYPLLHALQEEKLLSCYTREVQGRVRKYYELTTDGRSCLAEVREHLAELVREILFEEDSPFADH